MINGLVDEFVLTISCVALAGGFIALCYATASWIYAIRTRRLIEREAAERRRAVYMWPKVKGD